MKHGRSRRSARALALVALVVTLVATAPAARAWTLDPTHPVWRGPYAADWRAVLDAWEDPPRVRPVDPGLARGTTHVGRRVLVVPVLPADAPAPPRTRAQLEEAWFGEGEGSVRGYWEFVSGGRLALEGRVLPWIEIEGTLRDDYPNVIDGRFNPNGIAASRNLARDGLIAAASGYGDLRVFDDDGPDGIGGSGDDDGILDLVVIVHPWNGFEVDPAMEDRAIVSLQTSLRREAIPGTDLRAAGFVVLSATGPLGVWVHEFGHLLGLEDLYDHGRRVESTVGGADQQLGGLGRWSLMASGTWGDEGRRPSGLDAFSRIRLAWDDTRVVRNRFDGDLRPVDERGGTSIVVRPTGDWGRERFVVENRRRRAGRIVDGALPGSGVLVARVDDRSGDLGRPNDYVEVLQADGADDIGNGSNDGDAGDVFDGTAGADRLDASTVPSTVSYRGGAGRPAPVIEVLPSDDRGRHPVSIDMVDGPWLRLRAAGIEGDQGRVRSYLGFGESATWTPRFVDAGTVVATSATLRVEVTAGGRDATWQPTDARPLVREGEAWVPQTPVEITDVGAIDDPTPVELRAFLSVDGGPARQIDLGLPVARSSGLPRNTGFDAFRPVVYGNESVDSTLFRPLQLVDVPRDVSSGWGLRRAGAIAYGTDVDVAVESAWLPLDERRTVSFWSRQDVELDLPGRSWDGGVVEVFVPDRGWSALDPESRHRIDVWQASDAAVRGLPALGGDAWTWEAVTVALPDVDLPLRLRFRFASDGTGQARGWEIAGVGTRTATPTAALVVRSRAEGGLEVVADFDGDVSDIDQVRYRYRRPGDGPWLVASSLFSVRDDGTLIRSIDVPATIHVFEVGLFSEIASGSGATPDLLLGRSGYRRSVEPLAARPSVLDNPASGRVVLGVEFLDEPLAMRVFDVRGREVARFEIPAGVDRFEWDGRGPRGARLASGRYFLVPGDDPSRAVGFSWVK